MRIESAYRMLQPAERAWVDGIVKELQNAADREGRPMSDYLSREFSVPTDIAARDTKGMMTRRDVVYAVYERVNDLARESDLSRHQVIREVIAIATASYDDYIVRPNHPDEMPYFDLSKCTPEQMKAVKSIKLKQGNKRIDPMDFIGDNGRSYEIELVLHDKIAPLKMLLDLLAEDEARKGRPGDNAIPIVSSRDGAEGAAERYQQMIEGR